MACSTQTTRASLAERGLAVRGTFIDAPAEWFDLPGAATRRSRSTPPSCSASDFALASTAPPSPGARKLCDTRSASPSGRSEASTASGSLRDDATPSDDGCATVAPAEAPAAEEERPRWLSAERACVCRAAAGRVAELVEQECAFLRLSGHTLHAASSEKARRQGVAFQLRVFVRGLPTAKRAKWQQPLCWAAVGVLQRLGVAARMQGGELLVPLEQTGLFARLDFVAGRL